MPGIKNLNSTYFLRLQLKDGNGETRSINWYWLSEKKDELNWKKSKWYYTPQSAFTDFTALKNMPKTKLNVGYSSSEKGDSSTHIITITNSGNAVAFFVHLRALNSKNGEDILPVIFDDNYLLLAPGESRQIRCRYAGKDANSATSPYFLTSAWNLDISNSTSAKEGGFAEELNGK